jgi:hypothetical protein
MDNRLELLKHLGFPNSEKNRVLGHTVQQADIDKLETLICIEALLASCYQALEGLVHNQTVRKEYRQLEQHAYYHQEELKRIFPLSQKSEAAIENKMYKYLLQYRLPYLSLKEVINLAIHLTAFKMDIYKYFSHTAQEDHGFFNNLFEDIVEEMNFLCMEKKFHQHRLEAYLKV